MDRLNSPSELNSLSARRLAAVDLHVSPWTPRPRSTGAAVLSPNPDTRRMVAFLASLFLLSSGLVVHGVRPAAATDGIAFRGASSAVNGGARTLRVGRPAAVQAGDVMIASVVFRRWPAVSAPKGWTLFRRNAHARLYYRVAADSEPASYTWRLWPPRRAVGVIVAYSGVAVPPVDVSAGRWHRIRSMPVKAPSVTTSMPGTMLVGVFATLESARITRPPGMRQRADVRTGRLTGISVLVSDMPQVNPGPTGRRVARAWRATRNVGQLVALKPWDPFPPPPPPPPPPPGGGLDLQAIDSGTALLTWTAPPGTARIQVFRNGRLIDDFAAGPLTTYSDHLLWRNTSYAYEVKFLDSASRVLASPRGSVSTPSPVGPFPRLYADSSFWNQSIGPNPAVDPNSAPMVSKSLVNYAGGANFTNSDGWGYPIAHADENSKLYSVGCSKYDCNSDVSIRIPRYAKANSGSDHHLVVVEPSTGEEVDMWLGAYNPANDTWTAGSRYGTKADGWGAMCYQYQRCNGAVAAGFAEPGGVVRPEEIEQGHIDHALVIATPYTRAGFIACPATHTDGKFADKAALPEGARIQLDPSFNVDAQSWAPWQKVIARALQTYGAYVADTSGSLEVRAEANLNRGYDAWAKVGISNGSPSMSFLPWSKFRVLKLVAC
jgi:hypothetical protein